MSGTATTSPRDGARQFYDALAPSRASFVRRRRAYYDDIHAWLSFRIPQEASVCEVGCGIGNVLERLPNPRKTGMDYASGMIDIARTNATGTTYVQQDIEQLEEGNPHDVVLLLDTINSLWDVQEALTRIRRHLCHDRTRLYITYHNFLWKPLLVLAGKWKLKSPMPAQNWLSPSDVHSLLRLAGFEVLDDGERFLWPWRTPLIAPLFNRFLAKLPLLRIITLTHYTVARPIPSSPTHTSVSIVVPARNEEGNIARVMEELPSFGTSLEVIFVEGHSKDGTWNEIQRMQREYKGPHRIVALQQTGRGKGDAVRAGFSAATGEVLMILDSDLTVAPADLPRFYEAIANGTGDFINGSRLVYPMEDEAMRFLNILGNKFFSFAFSWLLGQPIKDTLCGTKVLRRSDYDHIAAARSAFGDFDPFGDFDLLFGASRFALRIIEIPVRYRARTYGETNIRRFRDGWLLLRMCGVAAFRLKFR